MFVLPHTLRDVAETDRRKVGRCGHSQLQWLAVERKSTSQRSRDGGVCVCVYVSKKGGKKKEKETVLSDRKISLSN